MNRNALIGIIISALIVTGLFAYADGGGYRHGYGGHHGMMGGYGRGAYCEGRGYGRNQYEYDKKIDKSYVEDIAHDYVRSKKHLTVGRIEEDDREYTVEIVTKKEGALTTKLFIDKRTGYTWSE